MAQKAMSFIFDNVPSETYGLYIGEIGGSSTKTDSSSTNLEVISDTINNRCENFIYGIKLADSMLKFKLNIFSYVELKREDIAYIDQWLFNNNEFKELIICQNDMMKFKYKAIINKSNIIYVGNVPYGFECDVLCDSLYAYESKVNRSYEINGLTNIRFNNIDDGYGYFNPDISFMCNRENGTIRIKNNTDNNREFIIQGLKNGEVIEIDAWYQIKSSLGLYRIGSCNKQFLRLKNGINNIQVQGDLNKINFTYQFKRAIGS